MRNPDFSGTRSPEVLKVGEQLLNVVVDHAVFRRIRDAALDLVHSMRVLKSPCGILIQADSGMGKTLLLELIQRELQANALSDRHETCLRIGLDSAVDTRAMAESVMLALGYPSAPSRPNLVAMNHLVKVGFEKRKPWALLIDEMQHVCEGNKDITARAVTDWLKVRMDAFNTPVICAGTHVLERLPVINPQFTSRASIGFVIYPFAFDDAWRQLLAAFTQTMSGTVDLSVINTAACRPLHAATGGNMRALKRVLAFACMHAATQEKRVVTMESLAIALIDSKGQVAEQSNPFKVQRREVSK